MADFPPSRPLPSSASTPGAKIPGSGRDFAYKEPSNMPKETEMNLYVGNLPYRITEDQLRQTFEEFGRVSSCTIIKDKVTGQSKGFGFLEMPESSEAEAAINNLNGRDLMGRKIN